MHPTSETTSTSPPKLGSIVVLLYLALHLAYSHWISFPYCYVALRIAFVAGLIAFCKYKYQSTLKDIFGELGFKNWVKISTLVLSVSAIALRAMIHLVGGTSDFIELTLQNFLENCIVPPLNEELVFRCLFTSILIEEFPAHRNFVVFVSALVFVDCHDFYTLSFVATSILGLLLAILYEKTRSLAPCVLLHFVWNLGRFVPPF